jgi:hypothetical protein
MVDMAKGWSFDTYHGMLRSQEILSMSAMLVCKKSVLVWSDQSLGKIPDREGIVIALLMVWFGKWVNTSMGNEKFCIKHNLPGFPDLGIKERGEDWNELREASIFKKGNGPM